MKRHQLNYFEKRVQVLAGWLGKFNIGPMQGRGVLKFRPEQPLTKEMGLPKFQLPST